MDYKNCRLCPRGCGVDRSAGEFGFCGCGDTALVAKVMVHRWEEPALAGKGGSGAIFFGGCTLKCKYCQNRAISGGPVGVPMDAGQLRQQMEALLAQGAENIDLVTPAIFCPRCCLPCPPGCLCRWCTTAAAMKKWKVFGPWREKSTFICRT